MLGYEREDVELSVRRLRVLIASRVIGRKWRLPSSHVIQREHRHRTLVASASTQKKPSDSAVLHAWHSTGTLAARLQHLESTQELLLLDRRYQGATVVAVAAPARIIASRPTRQKPRSTGAIRATGDSTGVYERVS